MRRLSPLRQAYLLGFRRGFFRGLDRARAELEAELARATAEWDGRLGELEDDYAELVAKLRREEVIREALLERDPNALLN
jgi:hypothetical protein